MYIKVYRTKNIFADFGQDKKVINWRQRWGGQEVR